MRTGAQIRGRDPSARIDTEVGSHGQWLDWVASPFLSVFGAFMFRVILDGSS